MSSEIAAALAKSKYSDLVHVTVEAEESAGGATAAAPREILLTATIDRDNGGFQWQDVSATEDPIARHLRTKIWVFPMLNDERRNNLYDQAIAAAAKAVLQRRRYRGEYGFSPVVHCLDIGSGTGLLAMMSAKYLQQAALKETEEKKVSHRDAVNHIKITSVEMSRPMAMLARQIVVSNGFQLENFEKSASEDSACTTIIDIIEGHSCEIPPLVKPKAVLCTSELLESGLLGEGWLVAMRDAWERHLHPDAVVVPQRARVYAQVVEGISDYWGPHKFLDGFPNQTNMCLSTTADGEGTLSDGSYDEQGNRHGVQVVVHLEMLLRDEKNPIKVLSPPLAVLDFDVSQKDRVPGPEGRSQTIEFHPIAVGAAEGVIFWWELDLYDDITYSTKHGQKPFQDHWHQCLYVFPREKEDCLVVRPGTTARLIASHTDTRIHFKMQNYSQDFLGRNAKRSRTDIIQRDPLVSPHRCWMLNNIERSRKLMKAVQEALEQIGGSRVTVLDISDFPLCGMMASILGAWHVTSMESSCTNLPYASAKVAQVANGLFPENSHPDNFLIVRCHPEQLTTSLLAGNNRANIIVGEPYYEFLEGHGIQEALNFHNILSMLKEKRVVLRESLVVPHRAIIFAQGIQCADIANAYRQCKDDSCGGFDHKIITNYWSFDEHPISIPLYEYKFVPVTENVRIATFDYEDDNIRIHISSDEAYGTRRWPSIFDDPDQRKPHVKISEIASRVAEFLPGTFTCHAITFWVEYRARESGSDSSSQGKSTGDERKYRLKEQVLILRTPISSMEGKKVTIPTTWMYAV